MLENTLWYEFMTKTMNTTLSYTAKHRRRSPNKGSNDVRYIFCEYTKTVAILVNCFLTR